MTGGKNGVSPFENLRHLQTKPVFEQKAELELSRCPAHPTKRMWTDPKEAIREAEVRSEAARMPIVAYRCDGCGNAHLCKAEHARAGSVLTREVPRVLPLVPGNAEAKRKLLREYLAQHDEPDTQELAELLSVGVSTVGAYMKEAGWRSTRGRSAKWVPIEPTSSAAELLREKRESEGRTLHEVPAPPANFEVFKGKGMAKRTLQALDEIKEDHPASGPADDWEHMESLDGIHHIPVGDLIDMLSAMGREIRISTRRTS